MDENYDILKLSDVQKETIRAYAECDMSATKTAKYMYMCLNGVNYNLKEIKKKTQLDPKRFYDLIKLLKVVGDDRWQEDFTERTTPN